MPQRVRTKTLLALQLHLLMLLFHERRARATVLLVLQTCKSGLALLSPQSLEGKLDVEAAAAKP
jgi:hypothetical protein